MHPACDPRMGEVVAEAVLAEAADALAAVFGALEPVREGWPIRREERGPCALCGHEIRRYGPWAVEICAACAAVMGTR